MSDVPNGFKVGNAAWIEMLCKQVMNGHSSYYTVYIYISHQRCSTAVLQKHIAWCAWGNMVCSVPLVGLVPSTDVHPNKKSQTFPWSSPNSSIAGSRCLTKHDSLVLNPASPVTTAPPAGPISSFRIHPTVRISGCPADQRGPRGAGFGFRRVFAAVRIGPRLWRVSPTVQMVTRIGSSKYETACSGGSPPRGAEPAEHGARSTEVFSVPKAPARSLEGSRWCVGGRTPAPMSEKNGKYTVPNHLNHLSQTNEKSNPETI